MAKGRRNVRVAATASTTPRRTNAEWSNETRAALLGAARTAFADQGYARASLDRIAAVARVTKGAIYHHYCDKRGLFRAVFEDVERQMVAQIERVAERSATPFEGVRRGCETFLDVVLQENVARIVLTDAPSVLGWRAWRAIDNEIGGRSLRQGLEAAMHSREIARVDLDALTALINGSLNEAALAIAESKDRDRVRRSVLGALRRLLEGLRTRRE